MSAAARTRARPRSSAAWSDATGRSRASGPRATTGGSSRRRRRRRVTTSEASSSVWPGVSHSCAVRGEVVAVAVVVEPQVVAVARPEVDDLGVREQRDVDRVVRVVVAQEDVGHGLGRRRRGRPAGRGSASAGRPSRVDDDQRVAVADQDDAAADAIARCSRRGAGGRWSSRGCYAADRPAATRPSRRPGCAVAAVRAGCHPRPMTARRRPPTSSCAAAASRRWTPAGRWPRPSRSATGGSSRSAPTRRRRLDRAADAGRRPRAAGR